MIRTWDFFCNDCDTPYRDYPCDGKIPESIPCECGGEATWTRMSMNHIHETTSKRHYGEFDPQFGCVVESYSHKQRLMKQMGLEEVGQFTEDQIREEAYESEKAQRESKQDTSNVLAAEDLSEIEAQIEKQTDHARKGELQESWVEL